MKARILEVSLGLFMRFGLRAVTMNDVAKELGISKKTLYQHFKDKEDLVMQALEVRIQDDQRMCAEVLQSEDNPVEALIQLFLQVNKMMKDLKQGVLFELQKYYPRGYERFQQYKREHIYTIIFNNLKRGQELGFYRVGINPDMLAKLFMQMPDIIMNDQVFPADEYDQPAVHKQIVFHFLHGIVTPEGRALIQAHKQEIGHEID